MNFDGYPTRDITIPHPHDVLCGRGGGTNNHVGNTHWRMLVAANKQLYVTLPKRQKMLLSQSIVKAIRSQNPPGRFLQKQAQSDYWCDVGDQRAQEKTSQALREGAPDIRNNLIHSSTEISTPIHSGSPSGCGKQVSSHAQFPPASFPPPGQALFDPSLLPPGQGPRLMYPLSQNGGPSSQEVMIQEVKSHGSLVAQPNLVSQSGSSTEQSQLSTNDTSSDYLRTQDHVNGPSSTRKQVGFDTDANKESKALFDHSNQFSDPGLPHLETAGLSFGSTSMMSVGNPKLETGGLSFGSMMSFSVAVSNLPDVVDSGLEGIGTSFGSLSLNTQDRINLDAALANGDREQKLPHTIMETPTILHQQKSKGSLLECSDTESEDDEESKAKVSHNWEILKEMLEKNTDWNQHNPSSAQILNTAHAAINDRYEPVPLTTLTEDTSALTMADFGDQGIGDDIFLSSRFPDSQEHYSANIPIPPPAHAQATFDEGYNHLWSTQRQLEMFYLAQRNGNQFSSMFNQEFHHYNESKINE
jgi:hypothetical protein